MPQGIHHKKGTQALSVASVTARLEQGECAKRIAAHFGIQEHYLRNWASRNKVSLKQRVAGNGLDQKSLRVELGKHAARQQHHARATSEGMKRHWEQRRARAQQEQEQPAAPARDLPTPKMVPAAAEGIFTRDPGDDAMVPIYPLVWGSTWSALLLAAGGNPCSVHTVVARLLDHIVFTGRLAPMLREIKQ